MLKYLPMLLLVHAGYSLMKWRKFLILENKFNNFYIPTDVLPISSQILLELAIAAVLCFLAILTNVTRMKNIKDMSCAYTYIPSYPAMTPSSISPTSQPAVPLLVGLPRYWPASRIN